MADVDVEQDRYCLLRAVSSRVITRERVARRCAAPPLAVNGKNTTVSFQIIYYFNLKIFLSIFNVSLIFCLLVLLFILLLKVK